jgi:hypothetical protein
LRQTKPIKAPALVRAGFILSQVSVLGGANLSERSVDLCVAHYRNIQAKGGVMTIHEEYLPLTPSMRKGLETYP